MRITEDLTWTGQEELERVEKKKKAKNANKKLCELWEGKWYGEQAKTQREGRDKQAGQQRKNFLQNYDNS